MNVHYRNQNTSGSRGQAIVEFAIVFPILIMILVGIFEVGRLIYIYASVNNASREAARYGSAIGLDDTGTYLKYQYCDGIKDRAKRSAYFTPLTISITYDHGPGTSSFASCTASPNNPSLVVNSGVSPDRVQVSVTAHYKPLINLVPIPERDITSVSARTIMGYLDVDSGTFSGTGSGSSGSVPTSTTAPNTAVPSSTFTATVAANSPTATVLLATNTVAATETATLPAGFSTFTPIPPSDTPTITPTSTVTFTPTITFTPTMTFTPTATSTPVPGCNMITTTAISIPGGSPMMSMTITNPHDAVTVLNIQVTWNSLTGGPASKALTLQSVSLAGVSWIVNNSTGSITTTPPTTVSIPGNNRTSTIVFTFDKNYQNKNNNESITINLSTPGCETYPIHRP